MTPDRIAADSHALLHLQQATLRLPRHQAALLDDVRRLDGANYMSEEGVFAISRGQRELGDLVADELVSA